MQDDKSLFLSIPLSRPRDLLENYEFSIVWLWDTKDTPFSSLYQCRVIYVYEIFYRLLQKNQYNYFQIRKWFFSYFSIQFLTAMFIFQRYYILHEHTFFNHAEENKWYNQGEVFLSFQKVQVIKAFL